jgi:hypothetical protein
MRSVCTPFVALWIGIGTLLSLSCVPASAQTIPSVPPTLQPILPAPSPLLQDIQDISDLPARHSKRPDVNRGKNLSDDLHPNSVTALSQEPASAGVPAKVQSGGLRPNNAALSQEPAPASVTAKVQDAYDAYTIAALQQRTAAFAWQAFASKIIFWLVVVLVLSGIAFSGIQFCPAFVEARLATRAKSMCHWMA